MDTVVVFAVDFVFIKVKLIRAHWTCVMKLDSPIGDFTGLP